MNTNDLISSFAEFKEQKNIDRETLMHILKEVFTSVLIKRYGSEDNFDIIINTDKGDLEIFHNRKVVEDDELVDPQREISLSDALKIQDDFEVGEQVSEPVTLTDFARREILSIAQNLRGKVQDYQKSLIFQKYKAKVGEIFVGEVYQAWNKEVVVRDEDGTELSLPKSEQIPGDGKKGENGKRGDRYKKGDTVRAVVLKVEMRNNNPVIILSRTAPIFLERLLEAEVPEINDGLITIRNIVRAPGERAKVVVESFDERIDAAGSCIGRGGTRIHGIVHELCNEHIDVISYTPRIDVLILRALFSEKYRNAANVTSVEIDEANKKAEVYMSPEYVSYAIGKDGYNIKLASKLVGYDIEIYRSTDDQRDDVKLDEFNDELDAWIIEKLINIGCDTARDVLDLPKEEVMKRADLEEETVDWVYSVLEREFEQGDDDAAAPAAYEASAQEAAEPATQADDKALSEFVGKIDAWVVDQLVGMGCNTAKSVLALPKEEVAERSDLEDETVDEVFRILSEEIGE